MVAGTLLYMAPEMLKEGSITSAVDIWSIGVLLFFILGGQYPFRDERAINNCNYSFKPEEIWTGYSQAVKNFIERLLEPTISKRLTAKQALQDPWIVENV
jgi:serine/threonine protein kinase